MSDPIYSEDEAREILDRAIELESNRGAFVRLDRLRQVALELGVSDAALERAIRERELAVQPSPAMQRVRSIFGWTSTRAALAMPVLGGILGAVTAEVRTVTTGSVHYETLIALVILGGISIRLIAAHRDGREQAPLQAGLGGLWGGFVTGFTIVWGDVYGQVPWGDLMAVMGAWWAGSAVTGLVTPWVRRLMLRLRATPEAPARAL